MPAGEFDLVVATASLSPKGAAMSEDRVAAFEVDDGACAIVCDGVGALPESAAVAEAVSQLAQQAIIERGVYPGLWELDHALAGARLDDRDGATTLVAIGAEPSGLVGHTMIGNGSVIEATPTELNGGAIRLLWTGIALPQIDWVSGRPALRSILPAPNGSVEAERGYRWVPFGRARLFLACSDGIVSEEERMPGLAPDGTVWQGVPRALTGILDRVSDRWQALLDADRVTAQSLLAREMEAVLETLESTEGLDDDASVAALLLRPSAGPDGVAGAGEQP